MKAELIARAQLAWSLIRSGPYTVLPGQTGWVVQSGNSIGLFGPDLARVSAIGIPAELSGRHAMSSDGKMAALSLEGRVCAIDASGRVLWSTPAALGEQGMGSCWFLADDAVVSALVPGDEDVDVLVLVDAATGAILDRGDVDTVAAWSFQFGHPELGWHGLSVGYGQNGSVTRWIDTRDGVDARSAFDNSCSYVGGVAPDCSHYVAYPHPACESVSLHSFPSTSLERSTTVSELFGGQRLEVQNAGYLDAERILLSPEGLAPIVVAADDLHVLNTVEYPSDGERRVCGPQAPDGTWTTNDPRNYILERWVLSD